MPKRTKEQKEADKRLRKCQRRRQSSPRNKTWFRNKDNWEYVPHRKFTLKERMFGQQFRPGDWNCYPLNWEFYPECTRGSWPSDGQVIGVIHPLTYGDFSREIVWNAKMWMAVEARPRPEPAVEVEIELR